LACKQEKVGTYEGWGGHLKKKYYYNNEYAIQRGASVYDKDTSLKVFKRLWQEQRETVDQREPAIKGKRKQKPKPGGHFRSSIQTRRSCCKLDQASRGDFYTGRNRIRGPDRAGALGEKGNRGLTWGGIQNRSHFLNQGEKGPKVGEWWFLPIQKPRVSCAWGF